MRKVFAMSGAVALCLALSAVAQAASMTVKGTLVDEGCGLPGAKKEGMKADCQTECAKNGEPVALVTAEGKVYRIGGGLAANKNAKLIAHMGHTVEITGDVAQKDGKNVLAADALKMIK